MSRTTQERRESCVLTRFMQIGALAGSLTAIALMLAPAIAQTGPRSSASLLSSGRPVGAFTPAVSDPRLAASLARRGTRLHAEYRITPAPSVDRNRQVRVAVNARSETPSDNSRGVIAATSASPVAAITPSSYNLGVSLGWRRFAVSGDIARSDGGLLPGHRESTQVGMSYRATPRLTGRVAVAAEETEGAQRLVLGDEAYSLDVGGAYSIARNIDVTAGARYRVSRDRVELLSRDERRDSQAVYIGTAFRF